MCEHNGNGHPELGKIKTPYNYKNLDTYSDFKITFILNKIFNLNGLINVLAPKTTAEIIDDD